MLSLQDMNANELQTLKNKYDIIGNDPALNRAFSLVVIWRVSLDSQFLSDILGDSVLVDEEVHGVGSDEGLGHIPDTLVFASLTP